MLRVFALCLLLPSLGGCYTYADAELDAIEVGSRVRARVSSAEADRLETIIGSDSRVVTGRVAALRPDSVFLTVPVSASPGRSAPAGLGQVLPIPLGEIRLIELRRLDGLRTAGVVAGTAALLGYILYEAFARPDPPGTPGENPPPVNQSPAPPLLSIPLGST